MKPIFIIIKALIGTLVVINLYQMLNTRFGGATFELHFSNTFGLLIGYILADIIKDFLGEKL